MANFNSAFKLFIFLLLTTLGACSTEVQTNPARTASEELLISSATDRAANKLALALPAHAKAFVDATNLDGTDNKYAIASIRSHLLQHGVSLADDRKTADVIIEARAGALSTDRNSYIIGIPSFNVPIPLTSGTLPFPEIALYGKDEQNGVAKLAVTSYNAKDGTLIAAQDPQFGFAHNTKKTYLIFFTSSKADYLPEGINEDMDEPAAKSDLEINGNGYSSAPGAPAATATAPAADPNNSPFKLPGL